MSRAASDTIAAVSSPPGRSARGLIRISGSGTRAILAGLTDAMPPDRALTACRLGIAPAPLPALIIFFPGPRSYTGDDLAEIQLPGNPALLDRVLHAILAAGARLAQPGEFTFRAYLAGKLDLTEAEGIAATIAAVSDSQLQAATLLREGALGRFSEVIVQELGGQLALVEAGIDFVDQDDVVIIGPGALDERLGAIEAKLADLLSRSRSWGAIEAQPRVVLVGGPSTGKSTLFNALLGRARAVISAQPGTTRDVLAEPLTLLDEAGRAVEVMLVDIAGLDTARGMIDEQMQAAARRAIEGADLLLLVSDKVPISLREMEALHLAERDGYSRAAVHIQTKWDLHPTSPAAGALPAADILPVSARTGHNLDALRRLIARRLAGRTVSVAADMLALQPRHEAALRGAAADLAAARALLRPQLEGKSIEQVELVAGALRSALDQLAGLGGTLTPDDVIGRVFATFCIGK